MQSIRSHPFADRRRWRGLAAVGIALTAFMPTAGRAQDEAGAGASVDAAPIDPEARRLAERGLAHYEAGRYDSAIEDFRASYRIKPAPGLLYNLAQAHRLKADCAAALDLYREFLAEDPAGNIRQLTLTWIAETERCATDKARPALLPRAQPPPAAPPSTAGAMTLAKTAGPRPPDDRVGVWRRRAGIGAGAAALVLGAASARYGWQASAAADDVTAVYDRGGTWGPYAAAREQSGQRDGRTSLMLGAGAVIAAAVSLWLLLRQ
jgi:tetratricopeptide (TPR) repeat protein